MRIIAGSKARMTLMPPRDLTTRPITDRVKEALFSILVADVPNAVIADLFCGTGSLGLEALSRGARHAIMVDKDHDAVKRARQNIEKLRFQDQATLILTDVFRCGIPGSKNQYSDDSGQPGQPGRCDLVFLDPPYIFSRHTGPDSDIGKLLRKISGQVAPLALVVVRHDKHSEFLPAYNTLHQYDRREYGNMALTFFKNIIDGGGV